MFVLQFQRKYLMYWNLSDKNITYFCVPFKKNIFYKIFSFFLLVFLVLEHVAARKDDFESTFKTHFTLPIQKGITLYVYQLLVLLC